MWCLIHTGMKGVCCLLLMGCECSLSMPCSWIVKVRNQQNQLLDWIWLASAQYLKTLLKAGMSESCCFDRSSVTFNKKCQLSL